MGIGSVFLSFTIGSDNIYSANTTQRIFAPLAQHLDVPFVLSLNDVAVIWSATHVVPDALDVSPAPEPLELMQLAADLLDRTPGISPDAKFATYPLTQLYVVVESYAGVLSTHTSIRDGTVPKLCVIVS